MPILTTGAGGTVVGAFTPASVTTLVWLEADTLLGNDGDHISTWADQSGNGRNATEATDANRPHIKAAFLNGYNVADFTQSAHSVLEMASLSGVASSATLLYVVKAKDDPSTSGSSGPVRIGTSATTPHYPFTDSVIYNDDCATVRKTVANPTPALTAWNIVSVTSAAADWHYFLGGTQIGSSGSNTVGFSTTPYLGTGSNTTPTATSWNGYIAELILVTGIDTTERQKLEGYLAWKYGIASVLDAGHPYLSAPP